MKPILLAAVAVLAITFAAATQAAPKTNVLFIAVDDLNDWVGLFEGAPAGPDPEHGSFGGSRGVVHKCPLCCAGLQSVAGRSLQRADA